VPIKWSAIKVSEAMDEVEAQVILADQFIAEAKVKAEAAKKIANLPQYMEQRLNRLIGDFERIDRMKGSIEAIRNTIPAGAIEAEQGSTKHGSTQSMM